MGETSIEWTDATWNPVTGCAKVSPGCAHCYAERLALKVFAGQTVPLAVNHGGDISASRKRQFTDVRTHEDRLDQPLRWRKPRRIFVNSMSDLFHEDVPDAFIDRVFAVMALSPWHTYQVLTKRAERMRAYCSALAFERLRHWMNDCSPAGEPLKRQTPAGGFVPTGVENLCTLARRAKERVYRFNPDAMPLRTAPPPFPNVWLGVSVENQHFADDRIPLLLQTPAAVRFISAEPLLGAVDLNEERDYFPKFDYRPTYEYYRTFLASQGIESDGRPVRMTDGVDWVIVGGESGPGARPFDLAWARSIVQQCQAAGVPVFVNQLGAAPWVKTANHHGPGVDAHPYNVRYQLRDRKGGDPAEWPRDLQIRQFPAEARA